MSEHSGGAISEIYRRRTSVNGRKLENYIIGEIISHNSLQSSQLRPFDHRRKHMNNNLTQEKVKIWHFILFSAIGMLPGTFL